MTGLAAKRARGLAPVTFAVQMRERPWPSSTWPGDFDALPPGCAQASFTAAGGRVTATPDKAGSTSVSRSMPKMSTRLPMVGVLFFLPESPRIPSITAQPPNVVVAARARSNFAIVFIITLPWRQFHPPSMPHCALRQPERYQCQARPPFVVHGYAMSAASLPALQSAQILGQRDCLCLF